MYLRILQGTNIEKQLWVAVSSGEGAVAAFWPNMSLLVPKRLYYYNAHLLALK
jgi:hypothetical protein